MTRKERMKKEEERVKMVRESTNEYIEVEWRKIFVVHAQHKRQMARPISMKNTQSSLWQLSGTVRIYPCPGTHRSQSRDAIGHKGEGERLTYTHAWVWMSACTHTRMYSYRLSSYLYLKLCTYICG